MWPKPLNPPLAQWQGRRVWLVGASTGIGAALARAFAAAGASVALSARSRDKLQQVAADCPGAVVLPLDVSDPGQWQQAYTQLRASWPVPDLIIFCAASYRPQRAWDLRAGEVADTLRTNLGSVYYGLETILPDLLQRGSGGIALVASVAGYMGLPNATVYGPTKAALINLAELLYTDLHPRGLGVYLINPGFVRTPLTDQNTFVMPALQTPEQAATAILQGLQRGRFEITFPLRFTLALKAISLLPYRLQFALLGRVQREIAATPEHKP